MMSPQPSLPPRTGAPAGPWTADDVRVHARERESWLHQVLDLAELAALDAELEGRW